MISDNVRRSFQSLDDSVSTAEIHAEDWNSVHVVALGGKMTFFINAKVASEVVHREDRKEGNAGTWSCNSVEEIACNWFAGGGLATAQKIKHSLRWGAVSAAGVIVARFNPTLRVTSQRRLSSCLPR